MRKAKRSNRLTALALSVLMVLTMTPVTASAQGVRNDGTAGEIIAFEALPQKTQQQTVSLGTALEDLDLPGSLNATVRIEAAADTEEPEQEGAAPPVLDSGEPAQGNEIPGDIDGDIFADGEQQIGTPSDVQEPQQQSSDQPIYLDMSLPVPAEWASSPAYDGDTAGVYTFTAEIEGFTLSAELPQIIVTVGTPAGVITAFENLAEEIRWQSVEYGTAWEDLNLPHTLSATVEGEAAEVPVDWMAEPAYDASTKGLYLLTAQLAEGFYATAELPYIAVVVRANVPEKQMFARSFGGGAQDIDPFLIGTAAQLAEIATLTNAGQLETMFLGTSSGTVYLKLDNDIDSSAYASGEGWVPIGNSSHPFKGNFDGDGHVISGLYINRPSSSYQGLFGYIEGGTIKNLGVVNADINVSNATLGGVAGSAIKSTTIENCFVTGSLIGNRVGGIAGSIYDGVNTIKNCYFSGMISAETDHAGGIAGIIAQTTVENCYTLGILKGGYNGYNGGIVGYSFSNSESAVKNCAALQEQVICSTGNIYRVLGYKGDNVILQDNIAFDGMTVNGQTVAGGVSSQHGINVTAADIKEANFFQTLFGSDSAWTYGDGKLPGFGAAMEMPDYIIDISGAYFNGAGTVGSPYEISTPQQLAKLAELVNDGDTAYNAAHYMLMQDIDLSIYNADNISFNGGEGWVPIGNSSHPFKGNFDGGGKTINNLYIRHSGSNVQGLFGGINNATIKNLGVVNADINASNAIVGGVAGVATDNITIENCFVTGSLIGYQVGGIAGSIYDGVNTIKNCYFNGTISAERMHAGGIIAGYNIGQTTVESCYTLGILEGGSEGYNGGIVGYADSSSQSAVQNCAALQKLVSGDGRVLGIQSTNVTLQNNIAFVGMLDKDNATNWDEALSINGAAKTAADLQTEDAFPTGFTSAPWTYTAGSLPILTGFAAGVQDASMPAYLLPEGAAPFAGAGTESSPYLIKTAQDLARLAELVNSEDEAIRNAYNNKFYKLENNLDLSGIDPLGDGSGWTPIGTSILASFSGGFNGNYKTITGLYINREENYQGLFGAVVNGTIKNLGVVEVDISVRGICGGITGYINGTVENCFVTGKIQGLPNNLSNIGGIAGVVANNAIARNCYSSAEISSNNGRVGGIAGQVFTGAKVENCYSTGSVSGRAKTGGIAGVTNGTVRNCVALNPSVAGVDPTGRVGVTEDPGNGILENNIAFSGMTVTVNNIPKTSFDKGGDKVDGADLSSAKLFGKNGSFWTTAANWETAAWDSDIWNFEDGKLPILKDTDGNVMPGQSGAPGLYLLNLSTDKLSITLAGTDVITGNGTAASPYTALASYGAQTVNVTVTGWDTWTNPDIKVTWKKGADEPTVISMDNGGSGTFEIPASFSGDITVTAASVSNPNNTASVTLTVSKRDLTAADFINIDRSKVYNGVAQALTYTALSGAGDVTLMYNGSSTVPTDADTYAVTANVTAGTVYNAATGISLGDFTITPKSITITGVTATDRTYDGTTSVTLSSGTLNGVVSGDSSNVSFTLNTGTIADANVGDSKEVITNIILTGDRADNYTLTQPTDVTVNIAKKALTLTSTTVADKEYDGDNTATVTGVVFDNLVAGESLELGTDYTATAVFSDANPSTDKTVTVTITSKATDKAKNYILPSIKFSTASIIPKAITGTVSVDVTQGDSGDAAKIDEGDTLTANISGITPSDATLSYQWYRGGTEISGATGVSYTIAARATDPVGSLITVKVTGTGNYSGEKTSEAIVIDKIALAGSVSVDGTNTLGNTLTLNTASLTPVGAEYSIQWRRDDVAIPDATGDTYVLTKTDLGKSISAVITATDDYSGTLTAPTVAIPAIAPEAPTNFRVSAGNGQLTLNWTAPFDGGSEITTYKLSTDNGAIWQDIGLATSYTITGLTNGTAYTVKLCAVNNMGEGADASVTATPVQPSSGGGGGSSVIVTPPAPDQPNAPTQREIQVPGRADSSGNITASITEQSITAAIDQTLAQARQSGAEQNGISLVLNVGTGSNQPINSLSFNLPKAVQDALIAKGVASVTFAVGNQNNTMLHISIDLAALKEISRQANGNVNLTATRINSGKLTGEGKKAIGSRPVFDLKASYGSGRQVQNFGAGGVSVTIPYVLGAGENAGNIQAVYVDANGKVQWLVSSVYDRINGVLRFSTNHFSTYGVGYKQDAPSFTDIGNHWAKDDIAFVVNRGLFSGTSETTFSPNTAMTRGMFVTALGRLANADVSGYKKSSFSDVKSDAYYMGYIEWANKHNIVNGVGNGRFAPDQSITREQMAVMMSNYAKVIGFALPKVHAENTFADSANISVYAKEAVKQMQMAGVISGKNSNLFDPQGTATRAEVSAVLRRFVELAISSDTAQGWTMNDSGKWMYFKDGKPVTGKQDIDGSAYTFDQYGVTADVPKNLRYTTYTVQKGDSFWLIAHKLGCTMSELERLNNKSRFSLIHPGDALRVPEK